MLPVENIIKNQRVNMNIDTDTDLDMETDRVMARDTHMDKGIDVDVV
jgi:hypothetical protein